MKRFFLVLLVLCSLKCFSQAGSAEDNNPLRFRLLIDTIYHPIPKDVITYNIYFNMKNNTVNYLNNKSITIFENNIIKKGLKSLPTRLTKPEEETLKPLFTKYSHFLIKSRIYNIVSFISVDSVYPPQADGLMLFL